MLCNCWYGRVFKMSLIALFCLINSDCIVLVVNSLFISKIQYSFFEISMIDGNSLLRVYVVIMNSPNNETRKGLLSWNWKALWNFFRNIIFLFKIQGNFWKRRNNDPSNIYFIERNDLKNSSMNFFEIKRKNSK